MAPHKLVERAAEELWGIVGSLNEFAGVCNSDATSDSFLYVSHSVGTIRLKPVNVITVRYT